jgi:5'(3')-deoxyribonucleotidase
MKSDVFLIDIDGVACAHAKAICKWVNKKYKINSKVEDITTWDHNFGAITFVEAVRICYTDENFILNMEVTPGFKEFFDHLTKMITVKFASTRKDSCDATRFWIKKNFGNKFAVVFVNKKIEISFDYLLDDQPEEVMLAACKGKTSFLLSQPWNNNDETKTSLKHLKHAYFVEDFREIINFLNKDRFVCLIA